jgi:general secretion pathway protein G
MKKKACFSVHCNEELMDTVKSRLRNWIALTLQDGGSRRLRRPFERGVTLVEVLIVVAIIAMVAGGVTVFALPRYREAQIKNAEVGARTIRGAVQNWQVSSNEMTCPTISQLVQEKHLDPGANTNDPWNQPYTLNCTDDEVIVTSGGPDMKKGTQDDIRVPKTATGDFDDR